MSSWRASAARGLSSPCRQQRAMVLFCWGVRVVERLQRGWWGRGCESCAGVGRRGAAHMAVVVPRLLQTARACGCGAGARSASQMVRRQRGAGVVRRGGSRDCGEPGRAGCAPASDRRKGWPPVPCRCCCCCAAFGNAATWCVPVPHVVVVQVAVAVVASRRKERVRISHTIHKSRGQLQHNAQTCVNESEYHTSLYPIFTLGYGATPTFVLWVYRFLCSPLSSPLLSSPLPSPHSLSPLSPPLLLCRWRQEQHVAGEGRNEGKGRVTTRWRRWDAQITVWKAQLTYRERGGSFTITCQHCNFGLNPRPTSTL